MVSSRLPEANRRITLLLAAMVALAALWPAGARSAAVEPIDVVTSTGAHRLRVEMARTPKEREKGLMFRASLPDDGGMLFDFFEERQIAMWMKNTPLSLDMIFVARDGHVVSLALGTEPFSERIISSGAPAAAVIEVAAGTAKRLSVAVGDLVRHPIFQR